MRIISGKWRRRMLPILDADGLRPTGDRVRETLFNWLAPDIHNARVLDVFSGSGALGLEALSRGANFVQFIEANTHVAQQLRTNLATLEASPSSFDLHQGDALDWLEQQNQAAFDIVFIDPPFAGDYWAQCISLLNQAQRLASEALIYVESPIETKLLVPQNWQSLRSLHAGQVQAQLFELHAG